MAKAIIEIKFKWLIFNPKISSACQMDPQSAALSEFNLKNLNHPTGVVIMKGRFMSNQVAEVITKYMINSLTLDFLKSINAIGKSKTIGKNFVAIDNPSAIALLLYFPTSK